MKTIKETVVGQVELSDLDLVVVDRLLGRNPEGHEYDWVDVPHNFDWVEGDAIPIDELEKTIKTLKSINANHVRIMSHSDHHGYYFTGINLVVMSEKEIKKHKKAELKRKLKKAESILDCEIETIAERKLIIEEMKKELENL